MQCDGVIDCHKGVDEKNCGFNTTETLFFGNQLSNIIKLLEINLFHKE